jgi:hypothetical protein
VLISPREAASTVALDEATGADELPVEIAA